MLAARWGLGFGSLWGLGLRDLRAVKGSRVLRCIELAIGCLGSGLCRFYKPWGLQDSRRRASGVGVGTCFVEYLRQFDNPHTKQGELAV